MIALSAMLSAAENTWMAFPIMTDATKIAAGRVGQKDVGAKVDRLRGPHKAPTSARQPRPLHPSIDDDEDVDVFWDRLSGYYGTQKRDPLHTLESTCSEYE